MSLSKHWKISVVTLTLGCVAAISFVLCSEEKASLAIQENQKEATPHFSEPLVPAPPDYMASEKKSTEGQTEDACGNQVVEGKEECDDGNVKNGDGCSSTCRKEAKTLVVTGL